MPTKKRPQTKAEIRAQRKAMHQRFKQEKKATKSFSRNLRAVARQVGIIVKGFAPRGVVTNVAALSSALSQYSKLLDPWARAISKSMVAEVGQRNEKSWFEASRELGISLRNQLQTSPAGQVMRKLMDEQAALITSLPIRAAHRVHKLTTEALLDSSRASEVAKEIARSGKVSESQAMLIARTEVARTASILTQTRAQAIGSDSYIWRTSDDSDVRHQHAEHNGKTFKWSDPPVSGSKGMKYHAGQGPNCRCYPEPIIPEIF